MGLLKLQLPSWTKEDDSARERTEDGAVGGGVGRGSGFDDTVWLPNPGSTHLWTSYCMSYYLPGEFNLFRTGFPVPPQQKSFRILQQKMPRKHCAFSIPLRVTYQTLREIPQFSAYFCSTQSLPNLLDRGNLFSIETNEHLIDTVCQKTHF